MDSVMSSERAGVGGALSQLRVAEEEELQGRRGRGHSTLPFEKGLAFSNRGAELRGWDQERWGMSVSVQQRALFPLNSYGPTTPTLITSRSCLPDQGPVSKHPSYTIRHKVKVEVHFCLVKISQVYPKSTVMLKGSN